MDLVMTGDQHRRFATAETKLIGELLARAAAAGLLPTAVATSYRARTPKKTAARTPQRGPTGQRDTDSGSYRDDDSHKLVFSVKQQHRLDQPKTVDLRIEPDRLTIFAGRRALEQLAFSDIKSWSTRSERYLDIGLGGGKSRRFATAETAPLGRLLSSAAAAGLLPTRTAAVRPTTPKRSISSFSNASSSVRGGGGGDVAGMAGQRSHSRSARQQRAVTPQKETAGLRFPVTQQHLWRAPRNAELHVDDRALRLVSGGEVREVYAVAALLSWTLLRGTTGSELLIDHARFVARNALTFGCSHEVGSSLATALAKIAPTRQLPSYSDSSPPVSVAAVGGPEDQSGGGGGGSDVYRSSRAVGASPRQELKDRIAVEAVFAVEQLMVKFWPTDPKRLLVGVGAAGLVAFTGGHTSSVVETFAFGEIFSWTTRPGRDITVLLRSEAEEEVDEYEGGSDTTVRRLTLRCDESEKLAALLQRLSRRAENKPNKPANAAGAHMYEAGGGRQASSSPRGARVLGGDFERSTRGTPVSSPRSAVSPAARPAPLALQDRLARLKAARGR